MAGAFLPSTILPKPTSSAKLTVVAAHFVEPFNNRSAFHRSAPGARSERNTLLPHSVPLCLRPPTSLGVQRNNWTPDNGLNIFSDVYNNRNYKYRYWDFFYFSAIALTTLGYGDILPNSTSVRVLVAIEAILGVVVITWFIGILVSPLRKERH